jgi:ankyrin repeat protein
MGFLCQHRVDVEMVFIRGRGRFAPRPSPGQISSRPRSPEQRAMALQTARFLVERGADLNAAGEFGWTAPHAAAYQGLNDVIESMAGHGANQM